MRQVNTALWTAIESSGMKRWIIAERCGISPKNLAEIVRGVREVNPTLATKIAEILSRHVREIFDDAFIQHEQQANR